jgi:hypothetical protein
MKNLYKFVRAAADGWHEYRADTMKNLCWVLRMICTIFMQAVTSDLHESHGDSYEEFCMIFTPEATNDLHEIHAGCYE